MWSDEGKILEDIRMHKSTSATNLIQIIKNNSTKDKAKFIPRYLVCLVATKHIKYLFHNFDTCFHTFMRNTYKDWKTM